MEQGSTHLGSMKSFTQESIEFSLTKALSAADIGYGQRLAWILFGMIRIVGYLMLQISLREGKSLPEAHVRGVALGGSGEGGFV